MSQPPFKPETKGLFWSEMSSSGGVFTEEPVFASALSMEGWNGETTTMPAARRRPCRVVPAALNVSAPECLNIEHSLLVFNPSVIAAAV